MKLVYNSTTPADVHAGATQDFDVKINDESSAIRLGYKRFLCGVSDAVMHPSHGIPTPDPRLLLPFIRYQTLIGDQMLQAFTEPSISVKTLFGADAHVFNNSENPSNPFVPGNGSGLNIDQAQVTNVLL